VARTSKIIALLEKDIGISFNTDKPWIVEPILQILGHPKTEEALVRLIKKSNGKFPVDAFCAALVSCYMYIFSKGYDGHRRPTISWDKNEFSRMAENARELHIRVEKMLNVMDPLRTKGKPLCKGGIELSVKGHYRDADLGGDQIDDERIIYALGIVTKFLDKVAKPKPKHRPRDIYLDHLMFELEHKFRSHCDGRPLHPVISDLVQATTDVLKMRSKDSVRETSHWTASRVITRLKRFYRSKENEDYIKRSKESWVKTPQK
jgi:hypothetical protein